MAWPLGYVATLADVIADGTAVAATTTQTSLLTGSASAGVCTAPANWFGNAGGQHLRLFACGKISTPGATQGNPTFTFKIGSINANVSPAFVSLASQSNITWRLYWDMTFRAVGSGTAALTLHSGEFHTALVSATDKMNLFPTATPVVGTGFDSTISNTLDLQVTWSNATGGNTILISQYTLEALVTY